MFRSVIKWCRQSGNTPAVDETDLDARDEPDIAEPDSKKCFFSRIEIADGWDRDTYVKQLAENYDPLTNSFWYYKEFVNRLRHMPHVRIVPMVELLQESPEGHLRVALRHDIDADPWSGVRCARFLAEVGVCGSFYLLHTAVYYGQFVGGCFIRNPRVADWIRRMIVAGCEIGLHNDSLGVYIRHGADGADLLCREIEWLRGQGATVHGTVAHNSGPIYGAENFEIFAEDVLWQRDIFTDNGEKLPLGTLRRSALGLTYEGVFARSREACDIEAAERFFRDRAAASLRSEHWMRRYLLENPAMAYQVDLQCWLVGRDCWVVAGQSQGVPCFEWHTGLEKVLELVSRLQKGSRIVFVLHPEYVRGASSETVHPELRE